MKPANSNLLPLIEKYQGNLSAVARAFNIPRSTVAKWVTEDTELQTAVSDARERRVDDAEDALARIVQEGNPTGIAITLNNMPEAKARGWGNRVDIKQDSEETIKIRYED